MYVTAIYVQCEEFYAIKHTLKSRKACILKRYIYSKCMICKVRNQQFLHYVYTHRAWQRFLNDVLSVYESTGNLYINMYVYTYRASQRF